MSTILLVLATWLEELAQGLRARAQELQAHPWAMRRESAAEEEDSEMMATDPHLVDVLLEAKTPVET